MSAARSIPSMDETMERLKRRVAEAAQKSQVNGKSGEQGQRPSQDGSHLLPDGSKPSPTLSAKPLEWLERKEGAEGRYSVCGTFSICRIANGTTETYEVWKLTPGSPWFTCKARGLASFQDARRTAERFR